LLQKGLTTRIHFKKLLPDEGLYVIVDKYAYVIELKMPDWSSSVDEKIQTVILRRSSIRS